MNQILFKKNQNESKKFKFLLFLSLLHIFVFIIYEIYIYYTFEKKENYSYSLLNSFNIERLYSSSIQKYTMPELDENFFIVGLIEIPKINIKYPILSDINDELLKISPCKFYGPYPNETGNLCIAGHNYDDDRFFGNLNKLEIGDIIKISDSNNSVVTYDVYDKFEIVDSDTTCTNQNTNGRKEITLVTCNNLNKKRLIIKAKEQQNKGY